MTRCYTPHGLIVLVLYRVVFNALAVLLKHTVGDTLTQKVLYHSQKAPMRLSGPVRTRSFENTVVKAIVCRIVAAGFH